MANAYGIELGATYSTIAKIGAMGLPEIIVDSGFGNDSVSSAVFFSDDGTVCVGDAAKDEGVKNPERLCQFFKGYIIGDKYDNNLK